MNGMFMGYMSRTKQQGDYSLCTVKCKTRWCSDAGLEVFMKSRIQLVSGGHSNCVCTSDDNRDCNL
jgi:hypothetical protein